VVRRVVPGTELAAAVGEILHAGHRATAMIDQLLAVSWRTAPRLMAVDVAAALDELHGMLRRVVPETIELVIAVDATAAQVRLDRGQLEQIVLNLVVNSVDAMPDGGRLTISARTDTTRSGGDAEVEPHPKRFVELTVEDTGIGMSPHVLARMFEPFFTTKPRGRGTGLGLSTVYGIVTQNGGHVRADSEPGCGCRIRVSLPDAAATA
jgi:signal transduction histidine kinase